MSAAREEPAVVLAGAHGERQARDLGGALVDLHAGEVLLEDEPRDVAFAVTALGVHLEQQGEGVDQDVTASARRVAEGDVLGPLDADEVLVSRIGLDVVRHALAQAAAGVVQHPQAPE